MRDYFTKFCSLLSFLQGRNNPLGVGNSECAHGFPWQKWALLAARAFYSLHGVGEGYLLPQRCYDQAVTVSDHSESCTKSLYARCSLVLIYSIWQVINCQMPSFLSYLNYLFCPQYQRGHLHQRRVASCLIIVIL